MRWAVPGAAAQQASHDVSPEAAFVAENDAAMAMMLNGMMLKPTGDADHDFATMMIAHHEGVIDMARAELSLWTNEQSAS